MLIRPDERIVFFGDSLTCRTDLLDSADPSRRYSLDYAGSYVDILVKRLLIHFPQLPFTFYNAGVGGDTVDRLLARYEQDVLPLSPTMMVLWVGQNDAKALCEERFAQQLHLLLQNCRRDHIQTVVLSTSAHRSHQKMRALERIDFILRQQSDEFGCPLHRCKSADGPPHAAKPAAGMADSAVHHRLPPVGAGESAGGGHGI